MTRASGSNPAVKNIVPYRSLRLKIAHVSLLDDLANVEIPQSHVFSMRAAGLVSGYM